MFNLLILTYPLFRAVLSSLNWLICEQQQIIYDRTEKTEISLKTEIL